MIIGNFANNRLELIAQKLSGEILQPKLGKI